jgi:hypothetical protein
MEFKIGDTVEDTITGAYFEVLSVGRPETDIECRMFGTREIFIKHEETLKKVISSIEVGDKVSVYNGISVYTVVSLSANKLNASLKSSDGSFTTTASVESLRKVPENVGKEPEPSNDIDKTLSERGSRYGSFATMADITQELKSTMRCSKNWEKLTASQKEALDMIQHKISRMLNGDPKYEDNAVDIVGYATLMLKNMQGNLEI